MQDGTELNVYDVRTVAYKNSRPRMMEGEALLKANKNAIQVELPNAFNEIIPYKGHNYPDRTSVGWVILDRKYIVPVTSETLFDAFRLGTMTAEGSIKVPLGFAITGTDYRLLVVGSDAYQTVQQEEKVLIRKKQVARTDAFTYGALYKNANEEEFLYLGKVMVPDVESPLDYNKRLYLRYDNLLFYKTSNLIATGNSLDVGLSQHALISQMQVDVVRDLKHFNKEKLKQPHAPSTKCSYNGYNQPIVEKIQVRGAKIDAVLADM